MNQDRTFLQQYTAQGSRQALDALVRKHMDLVYSAALRQVRNPHIAEDITQAVFLILAQKARKIRDGVAVAGWLLAVTRTTAVDAMRKRSLDRRYEEANAKPEQAPAPAAEWEQIAPVLDAALSRLPHRERDAIVLRVLENQSLTEVGAELGISQGAAKMRVARALARLKSILKRHGISTGAAALSATLATRAIHAAPAHLLSATLTTTATGTASASVAALVKGTLRAMARATAKLVAATALAFLLLTILSAVAFSHAFGPPAPVAALIPAPPSSFPPAARLSAPESVLPSIFANDDWYTGSNFDAAQPVTAAEPMASAIAVNRFLEVRSGTTIPLKLAVDAPGNVYAVGQTWDALGMPHGIVREKPRGQGWRTIFDSDAVVGISGIAVGPTGDVYTGTLKSLKVFRRHIGQNTFAAEPIDPQIPENTGGVAGMAIDDAENVYVAANVGTHWGVLKQTHGAGEFVMVDDFVAYTDELLTTGGAINGTDGIYVVHGVSPSAGVYVVGHCLERIEPDTAYGNRTVVKHWIVRRSRDEGKTWLTVDDFRTAGWDRWRAQTPYAATSDASGAVYVVGIGSAASQTANDAPNRWIMRRSPTGESGTWQVDNDFVLSEEFPFMEPHAMTTDDAGNVYVAGQGVAADGTSLHALIRTNKGGYWHTIDEFNPLSNRACWTALAFDRGTLYVAGWVQGPNPGWIVRSAPLATLETPHSVPTTTALSKH